MKAAKIVQHHELLHRARNMRKLERVHDDPGNAPNVAVRSSRSDKIQEGSLPTGHVHRKMDKKATTSINR